MSPSIKLKTLILNYFSIVRPLVVTSPFHPITIRECLLRKHDCGLFVVRLTSLLAGESDYWHYSNDPEFVGLHIETRIRLLQRGEEHPFWTGFRHTSWAVHTSNLNTGIRQGEEIIDAILAREEKLQANLAASKEVLQEKMSTLKEELRLRNLSIEQLEEYITSVRQLPPRGGKP